jgi:undecaprenyl-diphosphatase
MVDYLMSGISWIGFSPQSLAFGLVPAAFLFGLGLRWEAIMGLLAATSVSSAWLVKFIVERPRPSMDLVQVFRELSTSTFPSGHVLSTTSLCGYFAFLAYTLLKPAPGRTALLVFFTLLVMLMGPSRIYQGQHWFSDVMGGYLLGSLWLALTITIYRWGKPRYFVDQPVAPEVPVAQTA